MGRLRGRVATLVLATASTLVAGECLAGNCYQCEWGGSSSSCNSSYEVGGNDCNLTCSGGYCSCYTSGSCGSGGGGNPCRPKGCQQNLGEGQGSASPDRVVVTDEGLGALRRHSALLARLVTALRSSDTGTVYIGSVFNGMIWAEESADPVKREAPVGFSGATALANGVLTIDLALTGHAQVSRVRAEILSGGLAGSVRWSDPGAGTTEESW